jgi:SSS family solute:Na+ symporter
MSDSVDFQLAFWDYAVFIFYVILISFIGFYSGRKKKKNSSDYFLAGNSLPWYVIGSSFTAANISVEHFIGVVGAAFIYGICIAMSEWANVLSFTLLIWIFIPFLMASKVFSIPEFLEKRYSSSIRQIFAIVTLATNILAFLAAVLYGGGIILQKMFGIDLLYAILLISAISGVWTIYGGLKSLAWMDLLTIIVMVVGGFSVTIFGLYYLSGDSSSILEGFKIMLERNRAETGVWREVMQNNIPNIMDTSLTSYNRLSVIQPISHKVTPWPNLILGVFTISIWYNCLNQFMIQRVLAAKSSYHARMGIVFAGYLKILIPLIIVIPGLILFALYPEVLSLEWSEVKPEADKGYIHLIQLLLPVGLKGVLLAVLTGAIQSTISAVLNSTSTVFTIDIYKRNFKKNASEDHYVKIGRWTSVIVLFISIIISFFIAKSSSSLFVYTHTLYAFFAPPFSAIFVLGILFRRMNGKGALSGIIAGFILSILLKIYVELSPAPLSWLEPYNMQAIVVWFFCVIVCVIVSINTKPPHPDQVSDKLTINWRKLNLFNDLGDRWYKNVVLWWGLFVLIVVCLAVYFS